jgi:glycosyltransferase involved in cell wall biosynthesis
VRVLLVIDDLRRAGAQRVIAQEIRALHPRRVEFHVAVLAAARPPSFVPELNRLGVEPRRVSGRGLMNPLRLSQLSRLIQTVRPDVVHSHLTYANILGTLAAARTRRPSVASLHNVDINQTRWAWAKRRLEGAIVSRWATRIVVVSDAACSTTRKNFGLPAARIVILPNAVDPHSIALPSGFDRTVKRHSLGVRPGERLLCCIARLDRSKGHRYLLQALADLRRRDPGLDIRLVLAGGGPEATAVQRVAASLGLADRVDLLGVREDVAEIIAASDVLVLPSLNEGLSQGLLEAMALRTPAVVTRVGGAADLLEGGGLWCVEPARPAALADAVYAALVDRDAACAHAKAAHALVEQRFNMPLHLARLQDLYASVAGEGEREVLWSAPS